MMKEKANKTSAAPYKVKGAVLFTVVCVMMVLIVFLMGTLALAATANNRAHSNYQKAQTEATARAVLDAAAKAVQEDTDAVGVRTSVVSGAGFNVQLGSGGEIYKVDVRDTGSDKSYYDENDKAWKLADVYELSVTIDKTKADTTYSAYVTAKTVTTPGSGGGGGGGGAFVSMGGTSKVGTGGYITGGTYVGIDSSLPGPTAGYYTIADNDVFVDSPYYINGNAVTGGGQGLGVHFTAPGDYFAVIGDFTESQKSQFLTDYTGFNWGGTTMDYSKTPYIYIDGCFKLYSTSNDKIGNDKFPTNLYCGSLNGNVTIYGDIYTFDPDAVSYTGGDSAEKQSKLYTWSQMNVTGTSISNNPTSIIYGNWFSKGSIEYGTNGGVVVNGDLRAEGDIHLKKYGGGDFTVEGDIICGGTLSIDSGINLKAKNIYAGIINNNGNVNCSAATSYELTGNSPSNYTGATGTAALIGTRNVKVTRVTKKDEGYDRGLKVEYNYSGQPQAIKVSSSYEETKITEFNGIVTTSGPAVKSREQEIWNLPWDWTGTAQEYVESLDIYQEAIAIQNANDMPVETSEDVYAYDVASLVPAAKSPIYPTAYDKTNIRTTINLGTPAPTDYDAYKKDSSTFESKGQPITALSDFGSDTTSAFYEDPAGYYVIKGDCHIQNVTFDKNVYIDPGTDIRVILENCTFGSSKYASLIANDTHEVTLHIIGEVKFNMGSIFTKYYWDKFTGNSALNVLDSTKITGSAAVEQEHSAASDPDYPNLIINSDPGATLNMAGSSNNMMTAMVRAPQMTFKQGLGIEDVGVTYTNKNGACIQYGSGAGSNALTSSFATSKIARVSMIGQLIAGEIELPNDAEWGMIFVEIPSGGTPVTPATPPSTTPFAGDSTILYYDYY